MQSLELAERVMIYSMNLGIKCVTKLYPEELGNLHVNRPVPIVLVKCWKVAHWNAKKLLKNC